MLVIICLFFFRHVVAVCRPAASGSNGSYGTPDRQKQNGKEQHTDEQRGHMRFPFFPARLTANRDLKIGLRRAPADRLQIRTAGQWLPPQLMNRTGAVQPAVGTGAVPAYMANGQTVQSNKNQTDQ
jgi:hypothetical protein